jgi:hypothetical protein
MSTISFQVTSGLGNLTRSKTVTDAHLTRLVEAYQSSANASVGGVATNAQVITFIFDEAVKNWIRAVRLYEDNKAAQSGANITLT